jgi:hypothetical protein
MKDAPERRDRECLVARLRGTAREGGEWYRDVPYTEPRMQTPEPGADTGKT